MHLLCNYYLWNFRTPVQICQLDTGRKLIRNGFISGQTNANVGEAVPRPIRGTEKVYQRCWGGLKSIIRP